MANEQIVFILLLMTHVVLSLVATRVISKSNILTRRQKWINLFLVWTIPFVWFLVIRTLHKKIPGSFEIPTKNDVSSNNFYESGLGG